MAFTYNTATDVGMVRLLIADTDPTDYDFEDAEISAFLTMAANGTDDTHAKRLVAAAQALNTLASNRARLAVSVRRGGVTEDLSKVASELRAQAADYRQQAEESAGPLEAIVSPSIERFSYTTNVLAERDDETGEDILEAP